MSKENYIRRDDLISKVAIGTAIHISGDNGSIKYRSSVVGYDNGVLLTSIPSAKQLPKEDSSYDDVFTEGLPLVMRLIIEGTIYAFSSDVRAIYLEKNKLLMSSLPEKIQTRQLRKGVRYPCVLQAGFVIGETKYRGVLINISEGGCLFRMKVSSKIEAIKSIMERDKTSSLNVRFPFDKSDSSFFVKIKSLSNDAGHILMGMYYDDAVEVESTIKKYIEYMQLEELSEYLPLS